MKRSGRRLMMLALELMTQSGLLIIFRRIAPTGNKHGPVAGPCLSYQTKSGERFKQPERHLVDLPRHNRQPHEDHECTSNAVKPPSSSADAFEARGDLIGEERK